MSALAETLSLSPAINPTLGWNVWDREQVDARTGTYAMQLQCHLVEAPIEESQQGGRKQHHHRI